MQQEKTKIIDIIKNVLNRDDISESSNQDIHEEWDSMSYLSIVMEIESEFGISVNENNINNFDSVENIYNEIVNAKK